ncbi:MAG TPA: UDP-N-acetylglucosamine 2-epimerase [Mobilitalea sp.]|nr:UDP-N-acetylglucosamine 2-epimerase [Mobilitalea sp.]
MKKTISVLTATRAEYGLLKPILQKLNKAEEFDLRIAVTGMHLSKEHGLTYRDVEQDFVIDKKIDILTDSDTPRSISKSMGLAMAGFGEYFEELQPDLLLVLGDRYETLAVCTAAVNARIPIAHLYGGETTEGAVDECFRHAITKMSYLHFTSTEEYRRRVIQLGEAPERVFSVGAIGIENILQTELLSKVELEKSIGWKLESPFAVVTFHPVTLEDNKVQEQFNELLKAIDYHHELKYIFTKANADAYGSAINTMIDQFVQNNSNSIEVASLGTVRYLSALKYCSMVIGNSSSGLIEAPSFHIPTINIGDRQKGRLRADSVIDCEPMEHEILAAMEESSSDNFRTILREVINPYGDGKTSDKVVDIIKDYLQKDKINLKKKFYDITWR